MTFSSGQRRCAQSRTKKEGQRVVRPDLLSTGGPKPEKTHPLPVPAVAVRVRSTLLPGRTHVTTARSSREEVQVLIDQSPHGFHARLQFLGRVLFEADQLISFFAENRGGRGLTPVMWRYRGGSFSVAIDLSGYQTPRVKTLAPVSAKICCCVGPFVNRYRFLKSLISMSSTWLSILQARRGGADGSAKTRRGNERATERGGGRLTVLLRDRGPSLLCDRLHQTIRLQSKLPGAEEGQTQEEAAAGRLLLLLCTDSRVGRRSRLRVRRSSVFASLRSRYVHCFGYGFGKVDESREPSRSGTPPPQGLYTHRDTERERLTCRLCCLVCAVIRRRRRRAVRVFSLWDFHGRVDRRRVGRRPVERRLGRFVPFPFPVHCTEGCGCRCQARGETREGSELKRVGVVVGSSAGRSSSFPRPYRRRTRTPLKSDSGQMRLCVARIRLAAGFRFARLGIASFARTLPYDGTTIFA